MEFEKKLMDLQDKIEILREKVRKGEKQHLEELIKLRRKFKELGK
ncbi:MAG TPA: acetyl-CoA carboxylase carboxyl transferase subunit alpha, partial [Persephonella sp.]|nr:acetyl-CoA carboxylase carboxyl transferase subunit alpha [Persephonella sp.]